MRTNILDQYTNDEFANIVANSYSYADLCRQLGYNCYSGGTKERVKKRIEYLKLSTDHFRYSKGVKRNVENIFVKNSTANQSTVRKWFKEVDYAEYKCAICGQLPFWNNNDMSLILDHIDGDNHNNTFENLRWVCPNCNRQLDTTNRRIRKKTNRCIDCNKIISLSSIRCIPCSQKQISKNNNTFLPPLQRYELKELIRNNSFVSIGQKFHVTDNAVRKWCKKYNLPSKVSDIKQLSDREWELI